MRIRRIGGLLSLSLSLAFGVACSSTADESPGYNSSGGGGSAGTAGSASGGTGGGSGGGVAGFAGTGATGGGSGGTAATGGTGATGGSGGTAATGGSGGSSATGGSGGVTCNDPGPEPNDDIANATPVCGSPGCQITCSDSAGGTFTGVVDVGDVDYFTYFGIDKITCAVNAVATTTDPGFRLCMFAACGGGAQTTFKSCKSGVQTSGPGGAQGCCATAPGSIELDFDCPGLTDDDSADVWMRVDNATACTGYAVDYHF